MDIGGFDARFGRGEAHPVSKSKSDANEAIDPTLIAGDSNGTLIMWAYATSFGCIATLDLPIHSAHFASSTALSIGLVA